MSSLSLLCIRIGGVSKAICETRTVSLLLENGNDLLKSFQLNDTNRLEWGQFIYHLHEALPPPKLLCMMRSILQLCA